MERKANKGCVLASLDNLLNRNVHFQKTKRHFFLLCGIMKRSFLFISNICSSVGFPRLTHLFSTFLQSGTVRNIKQFHFFGWTDGSITKNGEGILDLIGQVQRTYEQQEEEGPITVHCR